MKLRLEETVTLISLSSSDLRSTETHFAILVKKAEQLVPSHNVDVNVTGIVFI